MLARTRPARRVAAVALPALLITPVVATATAPTSTAASDNTTSAVTTAAVLPRPALLAAAQTPDPTGTITTEHASRPIAPGVTLMTERTYDAAGFMDSY